MQKNRKLLIAGGLVAAVAASGGAFTAGITTADNVDVAASGNVTVAGAEVLDVDYTMTGSDLSQVTVTFDDLYEVAGANAAAFTLSVNGAPLSFAAATIVQEGGVSDDADTEGDATRVTFSASTPISGVTSTDIVVSSENAPADDDGSVVA